VEVVLVPTSDGVKVGQPMNLTIIVENTTYSMLYFVHQHFILNILSQDFKLKDDIVIDSGSHEHIFKRYKDIHRFVPFSPGNGSFGTMAKNSQSVENFGQESKGIQKLVYWVPIKITKIIIIVCSGFGKGGLLDYVY